MPEFTFAGTTPHTFPESRHSDGTPVRSVEPGEIRDLPEAINHQWRETTSEDREAWAAVLAAREAAGAAGFTAEAAALAESGLDAAAISALAEAAPPKPSRSPRKTTTSEAGNAGGNED